MKVRDRGERKGVKSREEMREAKLMGGRTIREKNRGRRYRKVKKRRIEKEINKEKEREDQGRAGN